MAGSCLSPWVTSWSRGAPSRCRPGGCVRRKTARRRISPVPLVGRAAEIARLQKVVAELQSGRGMVLSVRGEAGLGKSCLLGEVGDLVSRDVVWIEGQCRPYSPLYWPFLEMVRSWLGVDETEAEIVVRTRLRARLSDVGRRRDRRGAAVPRPPSGNQAERHRRGRDPGAVTERSGGAGAVGLSVLDRVPGSQRPGGGGDRGHACRRPGHMSCRRGSAFGHR